MGHKPGLRKTPTGDVYVPQNMVFCRDCANHRPHQRTCAADLDCREPYTARRCHSFEKHEENQ
jgi:hypothetical protein